MLYLVSSQNAMPVELICHDWLAHRLNIGTATCLRDHIKPGIFESTINKFSSLTVGIHFLHERMFLYTYFSVEDSRNDMADLCNCFKQA
jgi:hypothetical protein